MNLGAMAKKGYSTFPEAPALLVPPKDCFASKALVAEGVLPFSRDSVGVLYIYIYIYIYIYSMVRSVTLGFMQSAIVEQIRVTDCNVIYIYIYTRIFK